LCPHFEYTAEKAGTKLNWGVTLMFTNRIDEAIPPLRPRL